MNYTDRFMTRRTLLKGLAASAASMTLLAACGSDDEDDDSNPTNTTASGSTSPTNTTVSSASNPTNTTASGAGNPTNTTASNSALTATAASSGSSGSGSKVNIVYWGSFSGALGEAEAEVVKRFNESQSDVEVKYQFQGSYEETAQKLTQALVGGQAPDVSLLSDVWWFKFYTNQKLAPLNDFISKYSVDTADYVDSLYIEGVREDTIFWLPFARSTPLYYYNKDIWAEAGLDDRGPETWDELMEWAPSIMNDSRSAFAHPGAASYIAWLFQAVIWQFGGKYSDPDFTIRISEPEAIEAANFYKASTMDGWATTPADINADFTNGLTASMMASTGGLKGILETATFEVGTSFLPMQKEFGCCTGGAGLAVLNTSPAEKQEASFKFIEYATSPEITAWWSQNTGYMPVRKSAIASSEMQTFFDANPNFRTAVEQLDRTQPQDAARVFIPGGDQIIGKGLERITINHEDAEDVFGEVAEELETEAEPVLDALDAL